MLKKDYFTYPDVFGTTLLCLCYDAFGSEFINSEVSPDGKWSAETLRLEIKDSFDADITDTNLDKLMAAIAMCSSDYFYKSLPSFVTLCNAINGDGVKISNYEPLTTEEIAWAITESRILQPIPREDYLEDIKIYIRLILDMEGIISPPLSLQLGLAEGDYSDFPVEDPEAMQLQTEATTEIDDYVRDQLQKLIDELMSLPIRSVSSSDFAVNLKAAIEQAMLDTQPVL